MKKVLIIGGSYFVGRVFCIQASRTENFEITAVNRGRAPINKPHVRELVFDRNDGEAIREQLLPQLGDEKFDALIDTCAYEPGQIRNAVEQFGDRIGQYIYFSTASVYSTDDLTMRHEGDPVMAEPKVRTEMSDYVYKKLLLENELIEECGKRNIPYTILRPTIIFGPLNYTPRESKFIELIARGHVVPLLVGAPAKFNMVYVIDISRALQLMVGDERAYNEIFNLSAPEIIDRPFFYESLERFNGEPYQKREYTIEEAPGQDIPLTLPTVYDELYSGEKFARTFDFKYTPYEDAMKNTFDIFKSLYTS
ncbi:MAG: NAD-dependent epimerase/dehydratase family protein [Oscillospiraceae bacterium]|nr:NAD-dependent epimerase/dehydratase family protein [Oscillospiraceae bacterium]